MDPLATTPAGAPPDPLPAGWHGVYTGETLHPTTIALFAVLGPIAVAAVALRFHAAWKTGNSGISGIAAADWCVLCALVLSLGQESIIMTLGKYQRHQYDVAIGALLEPSLYERLFAQNLIAWPALLLSKWSILLLYFRLFQVNRPLRYAIFGGMALACVAYLPNIAIAAYFCAPHSGGAWDFTVGLHCGDKGSLEWLIASATLSVVLDIYILILPIRQVMRLNMNMRKRIAVLLVFLTASFACVCALLTLVYRVILASSTDPLWVGAQLFITNLVENFIAIIVSSAPGVSSWTTKVFIPSDFYSKVSSSMSTVFKTNGTRSSSFESRNAQDSVETKEVHKTKHQNQSTDRITVSQTYTVSRDMA